MNQVGITGGIGTGKSLVSRIFHILGVPVYDADSRAKVLYHTSQELKNLLLSTFGDQSYLPDGNFNRAWIAAKVFDNPEALNTLNSLVHPTVKEDYTRWLQTLPAGTPYVVREAALLYESGSDKGMDAVVVVTAPLELRMHRVLLRDTFRSESQIHTIMQRQWPEEEKCIRATYVIVNDDIMPVLPQVLALHKHFLSVA